MTAQAAFSPQVRMHVFRFVLCILSLTLLFGSPAHSQDPIFSLFQTNAMNYNPAHVGNIEFSRISLGYRNQYPSFGNAFSTYAASFDTYVNSINSGFGFAVTNDKMSSTFKETSIGAAYSYNVQIGNNVYVRGGLEALLRLQSKNPGALIFPDMLDGSGNITPNAFPYPSWNGQTFDVGAGFAVMVKRLKFGAAAFNISGKQQDTYNSIVLPNPLRINAYASYDIILSHVIRRDEEYYPIDFGNMSISPNIQYSQQYSYQQLSIGGFFNAGSFFAGLRERQDLDFTSFTIGISTGLNFGQFAVAASADIAQLGAGNHNVFLPAYEASFSIKLWNGVVQTAHEQRRKALDIKSYPCPY